MRSAEWAAKHFSGRAELVKNAVGNLSIVQDGHYVGYIDLMDGTVNIFEGDEDSPSPMV